MRSIGRLLLTVLLAAGLAGAQGAASRRRPFIGYLCAAGGQQGTVVRIRAGGQNLGGAKQVIISGEGVRAKVIEHKRTPWLLNTDQRRLVAQRLRQLANQKLSGRSGAKKKATTAKPKPETWPDHPMLRNLESLTPKELRRVSYEFLDPARRSQLSPQIAEVLVIDVTIDAWAPTGERELRIKGPRGLTNPVTFHVGLLPESYEQEPNDFPTSAQPVVELPRVLNGQVSFKDIDRFRFRAQSGQQLVIEVQARRLVPYLADAVPGWFQATLTLLDARGREIGFSDDYRFDPDPVLFFEVPEDGEYTIEIRDAIHRGREDFVYRIILAERPFITSIFPLGGRAGSAATPTIGGWNLPWDRVQLDTSPGAGHTRWSTWIDGARSTNAVAYAVDDLAEYNETGSAEPPQRITLPAIVNGRISAPGEVDVFEVYGGVGNEIVAEVYARRLGSPLDSLLQLTDEAGRLLAWNDDYPDKSAGLVTHQADSYLRARVPTSGQYRVRVGDTQGHGGEAYAYRLRLSRPRPDFKVIVTPASINLPAAGVVPITVHAVRRDGFDGAIDLKLKDAPNGFLLGGARIPKGCSRTRVTLAVPPARRGRQSLLPLEIEGRARISGRTVRRMAIPAEDMMQAFGLRHLVPAQQLLVDLSRSSRRTPPLRLAKKRPARIPAGGTTEVRVEISGVPALDTIEFRLSDPPAGVTLVKTRTERRGVVLVLAAERGKAKVGLAENLIVEAYAQIGAGGKRAKGAKAKRKKKKKKAAPPQNTRRQFVGVLPALPFEIVSR